LASNIKPVWYELNKRKKPWKKKIKDENPSIQNTKQMGTQDITQRKNKNKQSTKIGKDLCKEDSWLRNDSPQHNPKSSTSLIPVPAGRNLR